MVWIFVVVGGILVIAVGFLALGSVIGHLENSALPAVFEVDDAIDWIAENLPEEAAAVLTRGEVGCVIGWWLDYVKTTGLTTKYGEELGEEALAPGVSSAVADLDEAIDYVVAQALLCVEPLDEVAVVVVLNLLVDYLSGVGAIGDQVED